MWVFVRAAVSTNCKRLTTCKYLSCMYNAFFKNRVILKTLRRPVKLNSLIGFLFLEKNQYKLENNTD